MTLWNDGKGNYVNRYGANGEQWNITTDRQLLRHGRPTRCSTPDGNPIPCTFKYQYDPDTNPTGGKTDCQKMEALGYTQLPGSCHADDGTYKALYIVAKADGNPLFFPVDDDTFTPASELQAAQIPPYYDASATWPIDLDAAGNKRLHNFSFTSEVRYWFPYDASKTYTARLRRRRRRVGVHQREAGRRSRRHPHARRRPDRASAPTATAPPR